MKTTIFLSLLLLTASAGWAQDDTPIIVQDDGGPGTTGTGDGGHKGKRAATTQNDLPNSRLTHVDSSKNGDLKFGAGGFYIYESGYQAACVEMPAFGGNNRVVVDLKKAPSQQNIDQWVIDFNNGMTLNSGTPGSPINKVISITPKKPIVPDPVKGVLLDPADSLTQATLTRTDHQGRIYTDTLPASPAAGLLINVHYCQGTCNPDHCQP
jgi:hypothetical protein